MPVPVDKVLKALPVDAGVVLAIDHVYYEDMAVKATSVLAVPLGRSGIRGFDLDRYTLVFDENGNRINPEWNPFKVERQGNKVKVWWEDVPPYGKWVEWGREGQRVNWNDLDFEIEYNASNAGITYSFPISAHENILAWGHRYGVDMREFAGRIYVYLPGEQDWRQLSEVCYHDYAYGAGPVYGLKCPPSPGTMFRSVQFLSPNMLKRRYMDSGGFATTCRRQLGLQGFEWTHRQHLLSPAGRWM